MFSFFRHSFRQWARSGTRTGPGKGPPRRLQCEALEDRVALSVTSAETIVNSTKTGAQSQAATATSSNGTSVIVWTEAKGSTDRDIKAQRFDAAGNKVGGEIAVATGRNPQHSPTVAMDAAGNFVVVWTHMFSTSDADLHGAQFKADGSRLGGEFVVADTPRHETDASVGKAANGDFVVAYSYQFGTYDLDVKAMQFRADGSMARTMDVAASTRSEHNSQVAVAADGRFAVTYESLGNVYAARYSATGSRLASYSVATSAVTESNPDIAIDNNGNVLVVWQQQNGSDWNIMGRAISNSGVLANTFSVSSFPALETVPSVAMDAVTGKFIVVFQSVTGSTTSVVATEWSETRAWVRTTTVGTGIGTPSVSVGGSSRRFAIASQSLGSRMDDLDGGIFVRFGAL